MIATKKKRKGRRARGTGTIFEAVRRGKKVWIGRRVVGRSATGKTQYREVWGATQGEVVEKLAEAGPPSNDITVQAWATRWLDTLTVRPSTVANYNDDLQRIYATLGTLPVVAVKTSHIEGMIAALTKKGFAQNTIANTVSTARHLFGAAVKEELIVRNPAKDAKKPRGEKKGINPFSPDELKRIIESWQDFTTGALVATLASTGCRVGEACALDVPDWNPAVGTISITKTYSYRFGSGPPKSRNSRRTIAVPDILRPMLVAAAGTRTKGPLFLTLVNTRYDRNVVEHALDRALARLKIERRNVHQLRHSVATAMIGAGEPLADAAKYLGDTVDTVVKTYLHATGSNPAETMNRVFGKVGKEWAVEPDGIKKKTKCA